MSAKNNNSPGRRTPLSLTAVSVSCSSQMRQQQISFNKQQQAAANGNGTYGKSEKSHSKDNTGSAQLKERNKDVKKQQEKPQEEQPQQQQQQQQNNEDVKSVKGKHSGGKSSSDQPSELKKEQRSTRAGKKPEKDAVVEEYPQKAAASIVVSSTTSSSSTEKVKAATNTTGTPIKTVAANESNGEANVKAATPTKAKAGATEKKTPAANNDVIVIDDSPGNVAKIIGVSPAKSEAVPKQLIMATPKKQAIAAETVATAATPEKPDSAATVPAPSSPSVSTPAKTKTTTTAIDDFEMMEPLAVEPSPVKENLRPEDTEIKPAATSTPGKVLLMRNSGVVAPPLKPKTDVQLAMETAGDISLPVRSFTSISGRRSFRPNNVFTPTRAQTNLQTYRSINTELDVSSVTNTSLNVTVGSERPNNSSFSFNFFGGGGGRKRDRTDEERRDSEMMITSPPKRARTERQGFLSFMASPLTRLRNSFARTSIKGSSLAAEFDEAHNVSGVAIEEEIHSIATDSADDTTMGAESGQNVSAAKGDAITANEAEEKEGHEDFVAAASDEQPAIDEKPNNKENEPNVDADGAEAGDDDIKVVETLIAPGNTSSKNKNCSIM